MGAADGVEGARAVTAMAVASVAAVVRMVEEPAVMMAEAASGVVRSVGATTAAVVRAAEVREAVGPV